MNCSLSKIFLLMNILFLLFPVFSGGEDKKPQKLIAAHNEKLDPVEYLKACSFTIKGKYNIGTGFFISSKGFAVTCKHVIDEDEGHVAILQNKKEYPVGIISSSHKHDLAILLVITPEKTPYLLFSDPFSMKPGDPVYAVGTSAGQQPVVTDGLFTAIRKKLPEDDIAIQFSAPIHPGNSGGPLLDKYGKVLGVISWKLVSNRGLPVIDTGFAIPSDYLIKEFGTYIK